MKIAVLSESPADEAAVHILVEALLNVQIESAALPPIRTRGWPLSKALLSNSLKYLYYHTDADALVVVVDSDSSPIHDQLHERPESTIEKCRVCLLQAVIAHTQKYCRVIEGRNRIKTAVGLAVPAIEAWYLCGTDPQASEAALKQYSSDRIAELIKQLKRSVYGTDRPSLELETARAVEEATRLVQNLNLLEQLFPNGFGTLARDVRNW